MAHELTIEGKIYISSKRASEISGYAQDYIGQLARKQLIDAKRIGGLWYVFIDSLTGYKQQAEQYKPQPPILTKEPEPQLDATVSFDGKQYLSASRAAKLTGYHQDYIGQLARGGKLLSRQIGNRWYIERGGLLAHKTEKDNLLATVQTEAVGLALQDMPAERSQEREAPLLTYVQEHKDLIPALKDAAPVLRTQITAIPIRKMPSRPLDEAATITASIPSKVINPKKNKSGLSIFSATKFGIALTIILVISVGLLSQKKNSVYTVNVRPGLRSIASTALAANASQALNSLMDFIEEVIVPEQTYRRS